MSIIRTKRSRNFTVIPNEIINDSRLPGDALGLLVYLLSKPDDWKVLIRAISSDGRFGSHGKVTRTLGALRELGYADMRRHRDGTTTWMVYDEKQGGMPHPENGDEATSPHPGFGDMAETLDSEGKSHIPETGMRHEMPHPEKPHVGNRDGLQRTEFNQELIDQRDEIDARAKFSETDEGQMATRRGEVVKALRLAGVKITSMNPDLCQWVNSGITDGEAQEAIDRARQHKPEPEQIPASYLSKIVAQVLSERATRNEKAPAATNQNPGLQPQKTERHMNYAARRGMGPTREEINSLDFLDDITR